MKQLCVSTILTNKFFFLIQSIFEFKPLKSFQFFKMEPIKLFILASLMQQMESKIGDTSVKFTRFDCLKEEESNFCKNITCIMKPLNRTTYKFTAICPETIKRTSLKVLFLKYLLNFFKKSS